MRLCREEVRVYMFCSTLSMVGIKSCFDKQPRHAEISVSQHISINLCPVSSIPTAQPFSTCHKRPASHSEYQETSELSSLSHQWNRHPEKGQVQSLTRSRPLPQGPSLTLEHYLASRGTVTDRLQSGCGGSAERLERLLKLKDKLDTLEKIIGKPQS